MSRTRRNFPENFIFRRPKTLNEIKQNEQLLADIRSGDVDYEIDKVNRMRRHIPTHWDDQLISAWREKEPIDLN